jgi:hypothetical protein
MVARGGIISEIKFMHSIYSAGASPLIVKFAIAICSPFGKKKKVAAIPWPDRTILGLLHVGNNTIVWRRRGL